MDEKNNLINYIRLYTEPITAVKALLEYPLFNFVQEYYRYSRNYEKGLEFIEYCYLVITTSNIDSVGFQKYDQKLIYFNLEMLDCLNKWGNYLILFDDTLQKKPYYIPITKYPNKSIAQKYKIKVNKEKYQVHFLYPLDGRYSIVNDKFQKWMNGANVNYLKKHQQSKLSDEELIKRYDHLISWLTIILGETNNLCEE